MWTAGCQNERFLSWLEEHPSIDWVNWKRETLPHALCFHGNEPGNLFLYTSELIRALACDKRQGREICGICEGCKSIAQLNPVRFQPLFPQSGGITIEQIRNLSNVTHKMEDGTFLLIPVYYPSSMNVQAANAALKFLEEPLPGRMFLFINPMGRALLPTIDSRLIHYRLPSAKQPSLFKGQDESAMDLCHWHFKGDPDSVLEVESLAGSFSLFYEELADNLEEEEFVLVSNLQRLQSHDFTFHCKRVIAARTFLELLAVEEYEFLEKEMRLWKTAVERIKSCIQSHCSIVRQESGASMGGSLRSIYFEDYSTSSANRYFRGFFLREMEMALVAVAEVFSKLCDSQRSGEQLTMQEQQLALNYEDCLHAGNLAVLNRELVTVVQMIYNNLPWDSVWENLGIRILQMKNGKK
jgi:DNA polymerase III delta prime subunit